MRLWLLCLILPVSLGAGLSGEDEVVLLTGEKYKGKVIEETPETVIFEVHFDGGGSAQIDIPVKNVHTIVINGKKRVVNEKAAPKKKPKKKRRIPKKEEKAKGPEPPVRTKAELAAHIKQMGRTPPDWWNKAQLNYPGSLDLDWPDNPPPPWDPQKNVGQFIWSVINENPSRWKEGPKFLTHLMNVKKNNQRVVVKSVKGLARMWHNLFEDWARSAFWWEQGAKMEALRPGEEILLADCYWKLGCRPAAEEILNGFGSGGSGNRGVIKLWGDMGEYDKAIRMAEDLARSAPTAGYLAAGDICRLAERFPEALDYYQKVLDTGDTSKQTAMDRKRAQASLEAVKLFEALDVKYVVPGKYSADSQGYADLIHVEVTVARGRIVECRVTQHKEKQFYSAITDTPRRIIEKQSVKGVDCTTNATITSEAILNATAKALSKGQVKRKKK